jgi:hypothetical protein
LRLKTAEIHKKCLQIFSTVFAHPEDSSYICRVKKNHRSNKRVKFCKRRTVHEIVLFSKSLFVNWFSIMHWDSVTTLLLGACFYALWRALLCMRVSFTSYRRSPTVEGVQADIFSPTGFFDERYMIGDWFVPLASINQSEWSDVFRARSRQFVDSCLCGTQRD